MLSLKIVRVFLVLVVYVRLIAQIKTISFGSQSFDERKACLSREDKAAQYNCDQLDKWRRSVAKGNQTSFGMPSDLNSMTPRAHIMSARGKTAQTKQSTEKVANNRMPLYVRGLITQSSWKRRAFECKPFNFACNSSFFPLCCCSNDSQTSQTLQTCNVERYIVYWKAVLQQKHTHTHPWKCNK